MVRFKVNSQKIRHAPLKNTLEEPLASGGIHTLFGLRATKTNPVNIRQQTDLGCFERKCLDQLW
jgi:hypothetical protein